MLEEIHIENLGVIESANLSFGPGFTVITGETGAGKTMVLTGLGLLLGARAEAATVRMGAESAVAEGRVIVAPDGPVAQRVAEAGAVLDEDVLTIVRTIASSGRSRAHLGGRSVPQAVLAEIADDLVIVHGQADQMRLRSSSKQREALDEFAGATVSGLLSQYRTLYSQRTAMRRRLDEILNDRERRAQEADLLRFGIQEIEAAAPLPGEDGDLREQATRLTNVEDLRIAATEALSSLNGLDEFAEESAHAVALVEQGRRALENGGAHDPTLQALETRVAEIGYLLTDLGTGLTEYLVSLEADPQKLEDINQRRSVLSGLSRKYGLTTDDVLVWCANATERLGELDLDDNRVSEIQTELTELDGQLEILAGELTKHRKDAAITLSAKVTEELVSLAMSGAELAVEVTAGEELGSWGSDVIEFMLVPHAGAPRRSISKGASGGELSRVMLALEVALGEHREAATPGHSRTFVFDEVDAGVGGRAASAVGLRLAKLARDGQVVVVTHLAQVAAFADHHLVVHKSSSGAYDNSAITSTDVRTVVGEDRLVELARMLSGQDSTAALTHARELLKASKVR